LIPAGVLILGGVIGAIGGGGSDETPGDEETLAFEPVTQLDGETLTVYGDTSLPDGTKVSVTAIRGVKDADGLEDGRIVIAESALVADGEFTLEESLADEADSFPTDFDIDPKVAQISDRLTVCVDIKTGPELGGQHQSDEVYDVIGPRGEHLVDSPHAVTVDPAGGDGQVTWLRSASDIEFAPPVDVLTQRQGTRPEVVDSPGECPDF
jgi:hypothetical protein